MARSAPSGPEPVAAAGPSPSARAGLVERLERLEEAHPQPRQSPQPAPASRRAQAPKAGPGKQERQAQPVPADPPEATVTFVVRETRAPLLPSAELPPDLGTERNSALFDRLRSLEEAPEPPGETYSPSDAATRKPRSPSSRSEDLRQRREAEERAGIVRRFRKALSGD